jgi:dTDP-4-amino-4,6-dideoxygalactose transaminase
VIPFLDLKAQYRAIGAELNAAAIGVLESGQYVLGPQVAAFETAFARYCGAAHAVGVSTGTSALHLALLAAGVQPGDEVITVPMTFVASVAAIQHAGAVPKLVDIDPDNWTMDPSLLEAAITPRTRAILPVHLHGRLADMERICEIARAHGLMVIEDAAQSHGAELGGRRAGTFGDLGCFSFYPGKNLGACGEGGAVVTKRPDLAKRLRVLRDWGQERKYEHVVKGFNERLHEIQAALLSVKLRYLEAWTDARRSLAARYDAQLAGAGIPRPASPVDREHVYHVYAVRVRDRDAVRASLTAAEIQSGVHYPTPVHLQPAYADLGYRPGAFPISEALARETLSLPIFPEMTQAQVDQVCTVLAEACAPAEVVDAAVC